MKNLIKKVIAEIKATHPTFVSEVKRQPDVKTILNQWHMRDRLPKGKDASKFELADLKKYLIARDLKRMEKRISEKLQHFETIQNAKPFTSIIITMEWKRSRMWGNNPSAEAVVKYEDGYCDHFYSGSIGGCGYDKGSTAVAQCLNQVNGLLKLMYERRDKNTKKQLRDLLGYGSGYGLLPRIEGGVGVNCYPRIMEKLGYTFKTISSGKAFDVYSIEKIK